jgi:hypothetical protein
MSTGALIFLIVSWTAVLGLALWSYGRILRPRGPADVAGDVEPPDPTRGDGADVGQ